MKKMKRILALTGAIFFIGLYVFTFIIAIFDFPYKEAVLQACLFTTFFLAVFIAAFVGIFRMLKRLNGSYTEEEHLSDNSKDKL